MSEYKITNSIKNFIFGGNASFTIKNEVSGRYCKYKIRKKDSLYFISTKESSKWNYAGYLKSGRKGLYYTQGHSGKLSGSSEPIQGLLWTIRHADNLDKRISVLHHGKCACCGRKLDDEQSLERGFGPKCYKRLFQ